MNIKTVMGFRADFILLIISGTLTQMLGIIFIFTLFSKVPEIYGWNVYEIIFMYSIVYIVDGLVSFLFDGTWNLTSVINSGEFDRILLRPVSPVIQIVTLGFGSQGIGNFVMGIFLLVYSINHLNIDKGVLPTFYIVLFILIGVFLRVSINLCVAAASFWTKNGNPLMMANYSLSEFSKYPLSVYNWFIQVIVVIIPYAYVSFVPATLILKKDVSIEIIYSYPIIILYCCLCIQLLMKKGIMKYESVGN